MPASSANGAATAVAAGESNGGRNGSSSRRLRRRPNTRRICNGGASDVLLEKCRGAKSTAPTRTTKTVVVAKVQNAAAPTEMATSKCEEQLPSSSLKDGCCCCCCMPAGASRTTEMVQEDYSGGPSWDNLPSVILQEIFSYLPHDLRITASQVCKNWRCTLFHPSFWRKISFVFKNDDSISWVKFMANRFALSVHEATIYWDESRRYVDCVNETYNLLKKLSYNKQLKKLFLEFQTNPYDFDVDVDNSIYFYLMAGSSKLTECVIKIIETSNRLEVLSLGCSEELTANANIILEPLRLHQAKHLTHLSLASIRYDPMHYKPQKFDHSIFNSFVRLSVLTLDYDCLSDTLLKALDSGCMQRLVIHIHDNRKDFPGTTNKSWQMFLQKNPQCELTLNLIRSYFGVQFLDTDIFRSAMPLTHLRVLFCGNVNIRALLRLSMWYSHTLRSLTWIDSLNRTEREPATLDPNDPNSPDPMVLVAWKCTKLAKIVFLGYRYYQENLLAIARLRGNTLQVLAFAKDDIIPENAKSRHKTESITHEIQKTMGLQWMPLSDSDLPLAVVNHNGDSNEVILPLVLKDQK